MNKVYLGLSSVIAIAAVGLFAMNMSQEVKLDEISSLDGKVLEIVKSNGCLDCHSATPNVPFYGSLPVIGDQVKLDIRNGFHYVNFDQMVEALEYAVDPSSKSAANNLRPSEVDLAKIEHSTLRASMPPTKYLITHPTSNLTANEEEIIAEWVKQERAKHYSSSLTAAEFANEPITAMVAPEFDSKKAKLGFDLYHDTHLSKDNTISCATCHPLDMAGVDLLQFSKGIYDQIGGINAPTVYNAAFNVAQFWDGRKADLAAQAGGPPFDGLEMGSESWDEIIAKLKDNKAMVKLFEEVYPSSGMTGDNIMNAIAEFEMTLVTPNSKFDKYLKGDKTAMSSEELEGYDLFKEFNCATCHVGESLGGQSFEYMGIVKDYFASRQMKADREIIQIKDQGYLNATGKEEDRGYFKTPNLTNVALTYPYLHDGTAETLEDATKIMLEYQVGREANDEQIDKIVLFMNALTGEYNGKILTLNK